MTLQKFVYIFSPLKPPLSHSFALSLMYVCHKKANPSPFYWWLCLWIFPSLVSISFRVSNFTREFELQSEGKFVWTNILYFSTPGCSCWSPSPGVWVHDQEGTQTWSARCQHSPQGGKHVHQALSRVATSQIAKYCK